MSQTSNTLDLSRELQHSFALSQRIIAASEHLFDDALVGGQIVRLASLYEHRCRDVLSGRTGDFITIAVVGSKGQGKTWVARQLLLDENIRMQLPSGVLTSEATNRLYWVGPIPPLELDPHKEVYIRCAATSLVELGFPFVCLDTPGTTDANQSAAQAANDSMAIAPIQLLVIRRDQLRSATASQIVSKSEGSFCIPIITAVPSKELPASKSASESLQSDTRFWLSTLRSTAPNTQFQNPIYLNDFEASGNEALVGDQLRSDLLNRFHGSNVREFGDSISTRLSSAASRLKYDVYRAIESAAPQLATAVIQMQEAANALPRKAIESVLGSEIVLETAIRSRLRTQLVSDTSPLWFPYRPTLTLLAFTQGAWDRLIMAMTGSIPSLFGTFFAWAKNIQQSRKMHWDMQEGLRERLNSQAIDQLQPIQRQFHFALSQLQRSEEWAKTITPDSVSGPEKANPQSVRLAGIDELQSRSQGLFNDLTLQARTSRWTLASLGLLGILVFWSLLSGPIFSVYRQYLNASFNVLSNISKPLGSETTTIPSVEEFPHPSPSLLMTSVILSFLPMLVYAMIVLTFLLRRSKIVRVAKIVKVRQHALVEQLQDEGIVRLEFQDLSLQHAHFLLGLDRSTK